MAAKRREKLWKLITTTSSAKWAVGGALFKIFNYLLMFSIFLNNFRSSDSAFFLEDFHIEREIKHCVEAGQNLLISLHYVIMPFRALKDVKYVACSLSSLSFPLLSFPLLHRFQQYPAKCFLKGFTEDRESKSQAKAGEH